MTKNDQLKIAALRAQIQRIAFDANLYDRKLATYPYAERCSKKRKELLRIIDEIEHPQLQLDLQQNVNTLQVQGNIL